MKLSQLLLLLGLMGLLLGCAKKQYDYVGKEITKREAKEQKQKEMQERKQEMLEMLRQKKFALEAHTLYDRYSNSYPMNSATNFISVDSANAVIQFAFDGIVGWNGIGGVTLEGRVNHIEIKELKNSIAVDLRISGASSGFLTIGMSVMPNGNATSTVRGSFGGRFSFKGQVVSLDKSRVYKGSTSY
ncbi:DUF4251 domain-containing protein [Rapidithrix thailandica]|uniref:DUF4251 domain-containing protein n=1 Tax=Rapidithrix thailandica TaxID=413964 RepID=A0AAW9RZT7_9BACT